MARDGWPRLLTHGRQSRRSRSLSAWHPARAAGAVLPCGEDPCRLSLGSFPGPGQDSGRAGLPAFGFILGGAFGNLYDRIVNGTVTDFVEVHAGQHYFPAFNVAASAFATARFCSVFQ